MSNPLCIFHSGCPDGFTAAWIVHRHSAASGIEVDLHPGVYGEDPPDISERHVILVDFTYGPEQMERIAADAATFVVLDHHQTAVANCAGITEGRENGFVILDIERSGARITWDYIHPGESLPDIVRFVEDRDLWRFRYEDDTKDYHAALTSRPYTLEAWDKIAATPLDTIFAEGAAINRYRDQLIAQAVANADYGEVAGVVMPVANCLYAIGSDVAGALADRSMERVAAYYLDDRKNNVRQWGLRSTDDGPDVAAMAESMGGGGHKHAAGFKTAIP